MLHIPALFLNRFCDQQMDFFVVWFLKLCWNHKWSTTKSINNPHQSPLESRLRSPYLSDLGFVVLSRIRVRLLCSHMQKWTHLWRETLPVSKQLLQMSYVWIRPKIPEFSSLIWFTLRKSLILHFPYCSCHAKFRQMPLHFSLLSQSLLRSLSI